MNPVPFDDLISVCVVLPICQVNALSPPIYLSLSSDEAAGGAGEAGPVPHAGPQLVRAAGVRHHRRRPLRGTHVAHLQPQVVKPTADAGEGGTAVMIVVLRFPLSRVFPGKVYFPGR